MRRRGGSTAAAGRLAAVLVGLALALVSPAAQAAPGADISAPAQIAAWVDLVLDGSRSRVPPLSYVWTLESVWPLGTPTTLVEEALAIATNANADFVVLPGAYLVPGVTYEFRLTVTDSDPASDFVTHSAEVLPAANSQPGGPYTVPALGPFGRALLALALGLAVLPRLRAVSRDR